MKKLVLALSVLSGLFGCGLRPALALDYKTVDIRKTGGSPVRETFWAGDSIGFGYALEEDGYSYDLGPWDMVTWEVCTYTNPAQCWMAVTGRVDDAESGELSVETTLPLSVVPVGQYRGYVKGLVLTESNTVARQRVLVEQVVTVRYGQTEFPPDAEDNGDIIAGNAYVRQWMLDEEAEARIRMDNVLSNAIAAISAQGGGEPIWPILGFLPADRDESTTNEAYTVKFPTRFLGPFFAPAYAFALPEDDEEEELPEIESPFHAPEFDGLGRFDTTSRSFGKGLVLNSSEGSFLRMGLGEYASLVFSRVFPRGLTKATLTAPAVEISGESVTVTAAREEDGETVPGRIMLAGNVYAAGNTLLDGDVHAEGDIETAEGVSANSYTLGGVKITEWPAAGKDYDEEIAVLQGSVATNAEAISDLEDATADLQSGVDANAEAIAAAGERIDSLYGVCKGGFKWPDWFTVWGVVAGWAGASGQPYEDPPFQTNTVCNVVETLSTNHMLKGWYVDAETVRSSVDGAEVEWVAYTPEKVLPTWRVIDPEDLEIDGNKVMFADGATVPSGAWKIKAFLRGTLGSYTRVVTLDFDPEKQAVDTVVHRLAGAAPGSLLEATQTNIMTVASNAYAAGKTNQLRTWPDGYGSSTDVVPATWNTNFWGWGLGDFSCISYFTEAPSGQAGGVYRPLTMVTPRHAVCADHWKPWLGSNVYWVARDGSVVSNKVVAYKRIRGDLTVARLDHAFDTNDVMPATLLEPGYYGNTYGTTNLLMGLRGFGCISFDCAERAWVSFWTPDSLRRGKNADKGLANAYGIGGNGYDGPYKGNGAAVGGDSGSPSFLVVDGRAVLLGCFHTAAGGPMPQKWEIDEAIEAWHDEERCTEYDLDDGGWTDWDIPPAP